MARKRQAFALDGFAEDAGHREHRMMTPALQFQAQADVGIDVAERTEGRDDDAGHAVSTAHGPGACAPGPVVNVVPDVRRRNQSAVDSVAGFSAFATLVSAFSSVLREVPMFMRTWFSPPLP